MIGSYAQQARQEMISSAGGYNMNGGMSLSWTLGSTVVPTLKSGDGNIVLTHGFQNKVIITPARENLVHDLKMSVYPNPATDLIKIQFDAPLEKRVDLFLYSADGKMVKTDMVEAESIVKELDLQDLSAGIYYLRLKKGYSINVYKVVKL